MKWTERNGVWTSGPYTIELLAPEKWALSLRSDDSDALSVEVEDWWTGRSLREMKRRAASMEAQKSLAHARNRHLSMSGGGLVALVLVIGASGPFAALLTVAAAGTVIYGLIRALDDTFLRRPWNHVSETFQ